MGSVSSEYYCLWLPNNRDIFGFEGEENAPLNIFTDIQDKQDYYAEKFIFLRLKERLLEPILGYKHESKQDCNNSFEFSNNICFDIKKDNNTIIGSLSVFSNGLYEWNFKEGIDSKNFFNYIKELFELDYDFFDNENKLNIGKYKGLLNYYQIDLLLNGLLDENIAPSYFFQKENNELTQNISSKMSLENLFKSIILYKKANQLIQFNKEIERRAYKFDQNMKDEVSEGKKNPDKAEADKQILSFMFSMEQFIQVINFSLDSYERGLRFSSKQLSTLGSLRSYNMFNTIKNFTAPSLASLPASLSTMESYQTLLFEKLPLIKYLEALFDGLSQTICDEKYKSNKKHLEQVVKRYKRRIKKIDNYFNSIDKSLLNENQKNIQHELSEIRKYNEINNDVILDNSTTLQKNILEFENRKNSATNLYIAYASILIAFISPFISYLLDKKDNHFGNIFDKLSGWDFFTIIFLFIIAISFIFKDKLCKRISKIELLNNCFKCGKDTPATNIPSIYSRHIFDNTYPNKSDSENVGKFNSLIKMLAKYKIEGKDGEEHNINLTKKLPSVINTQKTVKCIKFDTFQEKYRTFKVYKFSFHSDLVKNVKYILHADVEYDFQRDRTTVVDVRIIVLRTQESSLSLKQIHDNSHEIKEIFRVALSEQEKN